MKPEAIAYTFGNEYPAAIFTDGKRLPLVRETRWKRFYFAGKTNAEVSRIMDGSTKYTLAELQQELHSWTQDEKDEFVDALCRAKLEFDICAMREFLGHSHSDCAAVLRRAEPGAAANP